jgi:periplasmic protein TonB
MSGKKITALLLSAGVALGSTSIIAQTPDSLIRDAETGIEQQKGDIEKKILDLEFKPEKEMSKYGQPRKRILGARTDEIRFATYIEHWRQKIERIGALNFPTSVRGKIYGSLIMSVSINADGSLAEVPKVERTSGEEILDDAAIKIVQLAAPFAPFPPEIRRDANSCLSE